MTTVRIFANGKCIKVDPLLHPDRLCHGQNCYLRIKGCKNDQRTVVPCHANLLEFGKGKGIKVPDIYTVPGCFYCHYELDQGSRLNKIQRRRIWFAGYARWGKFRERRYGVKYCSLDLV